MKRKWILTVVILTLLMSSFILLVNSSFTLNIIPSSSKTNTLDMFLPEYYFDLSKAPSMYKRYGKTYHEEFNFPIGTFGNNFISYGPHGIDRIALFNNFFDSFGGTYGAGVHNPRCLDGTFLGVYMNHSGEKISRILQQYSPTERNAKEYGLQTVEEMKCYSNIPIGYYKYSDPEFSANIGLTVYSPIILYDVKNSSLPTSVWNFYANNPTDEPIEVSFLFSLENDIGWRKKVDDDSSWQRTGTYNFVQENDDYIGVKYSYDNNMMSDSHPEYLGDMTLITMKQPDVTVTYVSEWNTLGDGSDLLTSFSTTGLLSNLNETNKAAEGEHIYAGALSARVVLEPGEEKSVPFVLSTCFPVFDLSNNDGMLGDRSYKWYWTNYFDNSWDIACYSLESYDIWWNKIIDWQEKIYSSGLPSEVSTFLIGGITSFASDVFFSKEGYWFTVEGIWNLFETQDVQVYADWFLCMFYPEIAKKIALEYCEAVELHNGQCPHSLWDDTRFYNEEPSFVIRVYRAWLWNQHDEEFLSEVYPTCKKAIEYRINQNVNKKDGLIHNIGNDQSYDMWILPISSYLNSMWLLSLKCMVSMAEQLNLAEDVEYYNDWFEKTQIGFIDKFWTKGSEDHYYFKLCAGRVGWFNANEPTLIKFPFLVLDSNSCMVEQIIGAWYAGLIDEEILPMIMTKKAFESIYKINFDYHHGYGWINGVIGKKPYIIDRFNTPNGQSKSIWSAAQWTLATSLLTYGQKQEGMSVVNITVKNELYQGRGLYFLAEKYAHYRRGTNRCNKVGLPNNEFFVDFRLFSTDSYPPAPRVSACWSLYQAASGITPHPGGLKIKPLIGGDDIFYMTQFAGCQIEINVTGTGDTVESVILNGDPYTQIIGEYVYIPLEKLTESKKMSISINLT